MIMVATMTRGRWLSVAGTLALVTILVVSRLLASPLILYPASSSLPQGPYLRTFGAVETGKIAAFPIPEAARRYQAGLGHDVPVGFSFMKPIVAGPGDHVCNSVADGLIVNGEW